MAYDAYCVIKDAKDFVHTLKIICRKRKQGTVKAAEE